VELSLQSVMSHAEVGDSVYNKFNICIYTIYILDASHGLPY
jgi:hypothetical protein